MVSIQAGGFNGGDRSTDFSEGTKLVNVIRTGSSNASFWDAIIGDVTWVKLQPAPMTQDLCSLLDLGLSLLMEPSWQFFILAISSECIEDINESEAQEVAQIAANAGLDASARINNTAMLRKNFMM